MTIQIETTIAGITREIAKRLQKAAEFKYDDVEAKEQFWEETADAIYRLALTIAKHEILRSKRARSPQRRLKRLIERMKHSGIPWSEDSPYDGTAS
jgi:hypothetical protein